MHYSYSGVKKHTVIRDAIAQRLVSRPVFIVKMISLLIIVSDLQVTNLIKFEAITKIV